jgi:hypothetical protein
MKPKQTEYSLQGTLVMPNNLEYRYILHQNLIIDNFPKIKTINLTNIFDKIYSDDTGTPILEVKIENEFGKIIFQEEGFLERIQDTDGIFCYHVNGVNLDKVLFYNTTDKTRSKELNINITYIGGSETKT